MRKRLFCQLGPWAYRLSTTRQIWKRHIRNFCRKENYASLKNDSPLPVKVYAVSGDMIKRGPGIDPQLQANKADNIKLACSKIDGTVLKPGESFSFWRTVGKTTHRNGFADGRVLVNGKLVAGVGGGLCNLANSLHLVVMHSPLTITELHHHSDALAPDPGGIREPYSAGTSVNYNYIDFRFRNDTDRDIQLRTYCTGDILHVELRTTEEFDTSYRIVEEDHHFALADNGKYYRNSKIYRETVDNKSGRIVNRELKWDNHSKVMFDPCLIPPEQIRNS